jgi:hypothetical protein
METIKKVNKKDFQVHQFIGGYYGICESSGSCVFGGDPANEDDYCGEYIAEVYDQWDGTLTYTGDKYGYIIEL